MKINGFCTKRKKTAEYRWVVIIFIETRELACSTTTFYPAQKSTCVCALNRVPFKKVKGMMSIEQNIKTCYYVDYFSLLYEWTISLFSFKLCTLLLMFAFSSKKRCSFRCSNHHILLFMHAFSCSLFFQIRYRLTSQHHHQFDNEIERYIKRNKMQSC